MSARRVLLVSPHFPPDTSAATHRMRVLAPHLAAHGWVPTVLTLTDDAYDGRLERGLLETVPSSLEVVRVPAWRIATTRRFGFGDLGLRAYRALRIAARSLLATGEFDGLAITVYPVWPAVFGPSVAHAVGVPFVLDLQDPWVGAWGVSVGGGAGGTVDVRSRLSRALSVPLERRTVMGADGLSAVSLGTLESLAARVPAVRDVPWAEIPVGVAPDDLAWARRGAAPLPWDAGDGMVHVAWVGTLLPLGIRVFEALMAGLAHAVSADPSLRTRLRLHCLGTSNQTLGRMEERARPIASAAGVGDLVTEHPARVDYRDALGALARADAILSAGSTERHYTASRLYPALLAARPLVAAYHAASQAHALLSGVGGPPAAWPLSFDDDGPDDAFVARATAAFAALGALASGAAPLTRSPPDPLAPFHASVLAGRFAALLDQAHVHHAARARRP